MGQKEEKKEKEKEEKEKKLLRAGGRTDGQTDKPIKGSTRGPRGPKNEKLNCLCQGSEGLFRKHS